MYIFSNYVEKNFKREWEKNMSLIVYIYSYMIPEENPRGRSVQLIIILRLIFFFCLFIIYIYIYIYIHRKNISSIPPKYPWKRTWFLKSTLKLQDLLYMWQTKEWSLTVIRTSFSLMMLLWNNCHKLIVCCWEKTSVKLALNCFLSWDRLQLASLAVDKQTPQQM